MTSPEPLLRRLALPWVTALSVEPAAAPPAGRWHAAVHAESGASSVLGLGVLEEFGTLSSPIFVTPRALVGHVYDAGIALAHRRNPELPLDAGWPPLVVGLDLESTEPPADAEARLLAALVTGDGTAVPPPLETADAGGYCLEIVRFPGAIVVATDAPLLPRQLTALAGAAPCLAVAVATGNRVAPREPGVPLEIRVAAEATVGALAEAVAELVRAAERDGRSRR